jgi:O-antigen ligase
VTRHLRKPRNSAQNPDTSRGILGLPPFDVSLLLFGVFVFTFSIVTYWLPLGEAGVLIGLAGLAVQKNKLRVPAMFWIYVMWILWAFLGSFFSQYPDLAQAQVVERIKLALIMLVLVNALRTTEQLLVYQLFIVGCYVLFPMRGAIHNYLIGNTAFGRAIWNHIYENPNELAGLSLLALGIALAIASAKTLIPLYRYAAAASAAVILVVLLMTQSRGAFLGLVIGMGAAAFGLIMRKPKYIFYATACAIAIAALLPDSVWHRFVGIGKLTSTDTIAAADPEGSAEQRWEIQKTGWRIFLDHPLIGVGLGTYPLANAEYSPELGARDTHNTYLNLAAELGLPGLLLWLCAMVSVLVRARRARKSLEDTGQIWIKRGLIAFLVGSVVGTNSGLTMPVLVMSTLWCWTALVSDDASSHAAARSKALRPARKMP